ncbi:MAG: hypothetical protein DMG30_08805 [Acidobacteria bacterium]|nr:MAG: hypothetical protein DMG30_08805 [Acidobacteriota bacterium]
MTPDCLTTAPVFGFCTAPHVPRLFRRDRARFIVNLDAATQSKLRFSAKLLALAQLIKHNQVAK